MWKEEVSKWRHVFKLDPNKKLADPLYKKLAQSNTDALLVGGTDGVTFANTWELLQRVKSESPMVPCIQEVSTSAAIVPGFDGYFIPSVLNSNDVKWIVGAHQQTLKRVGNRIPASRIALEGYIVLNAESKVARLTQAKTELDLADITAYARLAELFQFPICYLENSGQFGEEEWVRAARQGLSNTKLIYGGGIDSEPTARKMAKIADVVVVGNCLYENGEVAIQTADWVKDTKPMGEGGFL